MSVRDEIEDWTYYARRAGEERQKAVIGDGSRVAAVHLKFAEEYERRAARADAARASRSTLTGISKN